ncbi:hypothetical protein [Aquabacter cavernae]|uniref:hypothetical protein n=1 Tax=Aquabacter cavernae TaxID=2496029 RepID=UPI000F8CED82|nr:hypothetical protein [Aquabacter cavernae]
MSAAAAVSLDPPLAWRELGPQDLEEVDALHRVAMGPVVRPEIVKPESRAYFQSILSGRGRVIGAFGANLVAYGILQHDHAPSDRWEDELGVREGTPVGRLAGASVHPDLRGRRLQRATITARIAMAPRGMLLFSTAAPANTASWASLLAEGFNIHNIVLRYGGFARYLMVRDNALYDRNRAILVDPLDTERQTPLFAQGWHGFGQARLPTGAPGLLFAPPLSRPS